mgnify:CR=1 FL=1
MRRFTAFFAALLIMLSCAVSAAAENGYVIYSGDAGRIIFAPGSYESLTDLFPNFKDVMPGDRLEQLITVRNDASQKVKVKIYLRALGAQAGSEDFLSQLRLKVDVIDGWLDYMFDAQANEPAQMTDWVCLGTLYSGGAVDLNVILEVPVTMGNEFQDRTGYLNWEFMIEEFPVEDTDPKPPETGDRNPVWLYGTLMGISGIDLLLLLVMRKRNRETA